MMMRLAILLTMLLPAACLADNTAILTLGKALAESNCATCHAIAAEGVSPLREAPPFRDLALNYDEGELEDAFNEGVATEHPVMPDWEMTPQQAEALATYIMSLAPHGMKKTELLP